MSDSVSSTARWINIANDYHYVPNLADKRHVLLVIKSQDQQQRRQHMLTKLDQNREIGRVKERPIGSGLLVRGYLHNGYFQILWQKSLREPRHITILDTSHYLVTEIDRVLVINAEGHIVKAIHDPYFAFLHTVTVNAKANKALVVSSGYEAVFEISLYDYQIQTEWFAWEHGFNPNQDGVWLTLRQQHWRSLQNQNQSVRFIDPNDFGSKGVATGLRTAHINAAVYDAYNADRIYILTAKTGCVYELDRQSGQAHTVLDHLNPYCHGLQSLTNGMWLVTDTIAGNWLVYDSHLQLKTVYQLHQLAGKHVKTDGWEWLQQVIPVQEQLAVGLDANRGLVFFDMANQLYSLYRLDEHWCVQDALVW